MMMPLTFATTSRNESKLNTILSLFGRRRRYMTLVLVFVPKFEDIFKRLEEKGELPAITQILMFTSHFMQRQGWIAILAVVALVFVFRRWARTPNGRLRLDRIRLRIPLVGAIYLQLALSRFTRILGTLLHNGIPILQCLRIAKDSTGNLVLAQAIDKAGDNLSQGDKLALPLAWRSLLLAKPPE